MFLGAVRLNGITGYELPRLVLADVLLLILTTIVAALAILLALKKFTFVARPVSFYELADAVDQISLPLSLVLRHILKDMQAPSLPAVFYPLSHEEVPIAIEHLAATVSLIIQPLSLVLVSVRVGEHTLATAFGSLLDGHWLTLPFLGQQ